MSKFLYRSLQHSPGQLPTDGEEEEEGMAEEGDDGLEDHPQTVRTASALR